MCTDLAGLAARENDDAVRFPDCLQAVRDDDGGSPLGRPGERILNDEFRFRVDAGRG
ncbi:hypothetical protein [Parvibaculum sp.]|jgi:hypothetical protein|uniref:hypothetical protein n=1 Tax=Parvibaculum sp. TaxID=2024848 RepID=UPI0025F1ED7C|nr:hypothetical protein [Parvibaculum sp.]|tara:strand:+ start:10132 stop:10302 length:171 start_codon:yes stop_codon:yes gene_type:complete